MRKIATDERMPLSTQTLTWETVATFFIHAVLPFAMGLGLIVLKVDLPGLISSKRGLAPWIILYILISFAIHLGFLSKLQIDGCGGLKDWWPIIMGALKAIAITVPLAVAPLFSEWLRLLISQVVIRHLPLAAPGQVAINTVTVSAADTISSIATGAPPLAVPADVVGDAGVLGEEDYKRQTFNEWGAAVAYMSAFGGAIGFAAGSWGVTQCKGQRGT